MANKSQIPPNVKVIQLLCFYSHMKLIIITPELKEKKQAMSLLEFILPAVRVKSIHLKILNSEKEKSETLKMLYCERCRPCRTEVKSNAI